MNRGKAKTSGVAPDEEIAPLLTETSLAAAGFAVTEGDQQKFSSRLLNRAYSRMDLPTWRSSIFGAGGALATFGAAISLVRNQPFAMWIAVVAAAVMAAAFATTWSAEKRRASKGDAFDPRGCFLDDEGRLVPQLDEGETLLLLREADGRDRSTVRVLSGLFQAGWGVLLAGLPIAMVGPGSIPAAGIALAGTLLGAGIFGRGVRTLAFTRPVKAWALTSQRLVGMVSPGSAVSVDLHRLRHRPTLVGRELGDVTFGAGVVPLSSMAPLPLMGLVGFDAADADEGERWAGATMDARRRLLLECGSTDD